MTKTKSNKSFKEKLKSNKKYIIELGVTLYPLKFPHKYVEYMKNILSLYRPRKFLKCPHKYVGCIDLDVELWD